MSMYVPIIILKQAIGEATGNESRSIYNVDSLVYRQVVEDAIRLLKQEDEKGNEKK